MANLDIGIKVDNNGALKSLQDVDESIKDVGEEAVKTSKKTTKAFDTMEKGFKGVKRGAENTAKAVKSIGSALSGPAGVIAGLVTGGGAMAMFASSIGNGSALYKLNQATGISIKSLEKFRVMVGLAGGGVDDLKEGIQTFSERMGEAAKDTQSEWAKRFKDMGISVTGSVDSAMEQMLLSLAKMIDGGKRAQAWWIGNDIFGGAWEKMSSMVSGGVKGFELQLKRVAESKVFDERKVLMMQAFKEKIDSIKNSLINFAVEISSKVMPIIDGLFGAISGLFGLNLKDAGKSIGSKFATGFLKGFEYIFGKEGFAVRLIKGFNIAKGVIEKIGSVLGKLFDPEKSGKAIEYIASTLKLKFLQSLVFIKKGLSDLFANIATNLGNLKGGSIFKSISDALSGKLTNTVIVPHKRLSTKSTKALVSRDLMSARGADNRVGETIDLERSITFLENSLQDATNNVKEYARIAKDLNILRAVDAAYKNNTLIKSNLPEQIEQQKTITEGLKKSLGLTKEFNNINLQVAENIQTGTAIVNKFNSDFYAGMSESTKTALGLAKAVGGVISEMENLDQFKGDEIRRRIKGDSKAFLQGTTMRRLEPVQRQSAGDELDLGALFDINAEDVKSAMEARLNKQKEFATKMFEIGSVGVDMLQILSDRRRAINDREMSDLEKRQQAELNGIEVTATKRAQLEAKNLAEREALAEENKRQEKAWSISQIQIDTATAIGQLYMGAIGSGAKFGVKGALSAMALANIMAGMLTAKGIAQTAMIANYADGGIVPGNSYSGDKIQANVNSREMIINTQDQATLFSAIKSGNFGGNAPVIHHSIVIQGNITEDKMQQLQVNQNQFLNDLENGVKKLKAYGRLKNIF